MLLPGEQSLGGESQRFSIRSDRLGIAAEASACPPERAAVEATIVDVEFQAQFYFVEARLDDGQAVMCYLPEADLDTDLVAPDRRVALHWDRATVNRFELTP